MKPECEPFAAAILDDQAPKPAGLGVHLTSCADCAALRAGHLRAQLLRGAALPAPPRVPAAAVLRRGAVVLTALGVLAFAFLRPADPPPVEVVEAPTRTPPGETQLVAAPLKPEGSLEALALLDQTVTRYARVNPIAAGYGERFGSLPYYLAPQESP